MKKRKKLVLFVFIFAYIFILLLLRGKVVEKSRQIYQKEKELLELEYRVNLKKMEFLKMCFLNEEKQHYYAEKK